jgi:protein-tyrosine phosphatase
MFWISKKAVTLSDAWQDGFIDMHNHLLPGIDDGSKSIAQTEAMIVGMQELGITEAIATPHTYPGLWENNIHSITNAYKGTPNTFISGCSSEYFADTYLIELAEKQELIPLKDNHLLIEFSMMSAPVDALMDVLFSLKLKEYQLILAHPERYLYWEKSLSAFEQLKSFDLSFQLNALSLLGYYGANCKKITEFLLENDFYDHMGTDFHSMHHIHYAKNHTFPEKYLKKISALVEANQIFRTK